MARILGKPEMQNRTSHGHVMSGTLFKGVHPIPDIDSVFFYVVHVGDCGKL